MSSRGRAPVFVVGCPRSGTTLLYHMLLSSGGFAYYRAETHAFDVLGPRFGHLQSERMRRKFLDRWIDSHPFRLSGLDPEAIRQQVLRSCHNCGDFLRIVMGSIAQQQGVERWAECTPIHVLYMSEIKASIPDAVFLHIIRDGRDVALSLAKEGWMSPFPWDKDKRLLVAGLRWQWIVEQGRRNGSAIGPDYREVRFEELIREPRTALENVGLFIDHDLNYDEIRRVGIGSVAHPNTSFGGEVHEGVFNPVGRWKEQFSQEELSMFEATLGPVLRDLGYGVASRGVDSWHEVRLKAVRSAYRWYHSMRHWAKARTMLGRLTNLDVLEEPMTSHSPSVEMR